MSVKERLRLYEAHEYVSDATTGTSATARDLEDEERPQLPTRPRPSNGRSPKDKEAVPQLPPRPGDEVAPSLPPRPSNETESSPSRRAALPNDSITRKPRPPVPPKSKSISGRLATTQRVSDANQIKLIDIEEEVPDGSVLHLLHPEPLEDEDEPENVRWERQNSLQAPSSKPRRASRTPSPLRDVQKTFVKLGADTAGAFDKAGFPKMFRSVSETTQVGFQKVQMEAPKAFQGIADGSQKAFKNVASQTPGAFKIASERTQKVFNDVQAGVKRTVNGIPVPSAFAQTGEDFSDLTKLQLGSKGVCSRCASLPLERCFYEPLETDEAYVPWATPLTRVALHAKWCRLCQLLLSVLCRLENDPLLLPEVRDYISPEWLRGVPLHKWVTEGYIHQDEYWPFGRSEHRDEGSTQVVGPVAEIVWAMAKRSSGIGVKVLAQTASGRRPQVRLNDFKRTNAQAYRDGYKQGKAQISRFPVSCVLMITVSGKGADIPGLLWVDLVGCSNAPGSEHKVLSHFMLRAVRNGFSVNVAPGKPLSYGHRLDPNWINIAVGKLWLSECETRHGKQCNEPGWAAAMGKPTFLRLMDVENLSIVVAEKPASVRYVALSYVWGGAQVLKLRYSNVNSLSKSNGLQQYLAQLPRTITDAIEVVRELGERYLWIDALCILQEDTKESHDQIANMDLVYGSAVLTIAAASGDTANSGLRGIRRKHDDASDLNGARNISQLTAAMGRDIDVLASTPSQQRLETSAWNTRAWTFQERLLSRRLLTFADDEMVWHCRCMVAKEDMSAEDTGSETGTLEWLNLKSQYLGIGTDQHWKDGSFEMTRHGQTHVVRSGTFAEYAKLIREYSSRKITYDSDAINALAGLLRIFSLCFQAECIYGLPSSLLDIALLWRPVEPLARRTGDVTFPSWSWAAWKGRVAYDDPIEVNRDETGQKMKTEGIRPLLRYFVLDRHTGSLQPLNGTGRGLPLDDRDVPEEWEAHAAVDDCRSVTHTCTEPPDIFDLNPRIISQLSSRHLILWTSVTGAFTLGSLAPQRIDSKFDSARHPCRSSLYDVDLNEVGNLLFDCTPPEYLQPGQHEFILVAEAQSSLLDVETVTGAYPYYLVMLVETDVESGISNRIGIGRIVKTAWAVAQPDIRLICLG